MKIIFLDIDGVINNKRSEEYFSSLGLASVEDFFQIRNYSFKRFCPVNLIQLKSLLKSSKAKIVIHSSWRKQFDIEELKNFFSYHGIDRENILGISSVEGTKEESIRSWLSNNPVKAYIIFDDEKIIEDVGFIKTNPEVGLTPENRRQALTLLTAQDNE